MEEIFRFFVKNWRFSLLMTLFTLIAGLVGLKLLQKEAFPPVNFAQVQVTTIYPGASPEEVQDRVTTVIEDELRGIDGIKDVKSTSQSEQSKISIRIDIDNVDSTRVVNDIQRAVQRATSRLPTDLPDAPLVTEVKAREIPVIEVALVGENNDRQRDKLADRLKEIIEDEKGVGSVRLSGYQEREIQILLNRNKLVTYGTGLTEVINALASRIKNVPAGYVGDETVSLVRVLGQTSDLNEISNLIVRTNDSGLQVRVKDLGRVIDGGEKLRIRSRVNGEAATLLVATKKQDADALATVTSVRSKIEEFQKSLPEGYKLVIYNDEGRRIQNRLDIVVFNGVTGLIIVLLVLFLFLPGKIGLFSALSLPVCALGTVAMMVYLGANFNIITMLALIICLGNLVDNSVVISENYTKLREEGLEPEEAAVKSAKQFWIPFTASTITIIAAFLPMLVTKGVMGQFIRWIPIVVTIALSLSLLEALTLLPARLRFLSPRTRAQEVQTNWFTRVENGFGQFIAWTLKNRKKTFIGLSSLMLSGLLVTVLFNRFELFPAEGPEYYVSRFSLPPETSVKQTDQVAQVLSEKVIEVLGPDILKSVVARAGLQQVNPGDPQAKSGEHVGFLLIAIHPEIAPNLDIKETLSKLRAIAKPEIVTKLTFETIQGGPPVGKPLTLTLRSNDENQLNALAQKILEKVRATSGVLSVEDDNEDSGNEYRWKIRSGDAALAGLTVENVGLNLRTALEGTTVAKLTEQGNEFEISVMFDDPDKSDVEDLKRTGILNQRGNLVPLSYLGDFERGPSPRTRKNYDFKRAITISGDVDPTKITSTALNAQVRQFLNVELPNYPDVSVIYGGEEEATKESLQSLGIALLLAIFGIFATLVFTLRSFTLPLLILSTIPLGLIGVFYAFALNQRPLSFLAFVGVVGLSGVVINSAIILVDYIEELRAELKDRSLDEILVLASTRRLRAVLATGLTTVVGLVPTAFSLGGYDPILVPMTLALQWGMIVGTVLSLVWIPSGYIYIFAVKNRVNAYLSKWKLS